METKKNTKQFHGICHLQMFKWKNQNSQDKKILLKYFPKHIDSFPSFLKTKRNLQTRIKHLKLIRSIPEYEHKECFYGYWRQMVLNKRKTIKVKVFPQVSDFEFSQGYSKQSVQLLKMLPNVQNVEFCLEPHYREWEYELDQEDEEDEDVKYMRQQKYWQKKMLKYLPSMPFLKHLKFSDRCFHLLPLFSKLNSLEAMLKNLDVLQVYLSFAGLGYRDFQDLLGYKTVFKYLTHLKMEMSGEKESCEVFRLLPHSCPRLSFLSLETKNSDLEDENSLECLQAFQNLQRLKLKLNRKLGIFTQCKLPSSLRHLGLYFALVDWRSLIKNPESFFQNKVESLQKLEKLHLDFGNYYRPEKEEALIKCFIQDLSKTIVALKVFIIKFSPNYLFDLSQFLQLLGHHDQSLETLFIDVNIRYGFVNFESNSIHFPKLSYLSLNAKEIPSEATTLENIIGLVQAKSEKSPSCVNISQVKVENYKALLSLFRTLKKMKDLREKHLWLTVIYFGGKENKSFLDYEKVKRNSRNLKNVFLEIQFPKKYPNWKLQRNLLRLKPLFGDFNVYYEGDE